MFSLAHFSDLHLGPLPRGAIRRHFALKRSIGVLNWRLNRHRVHDPAVALAMSRDIIEHEPSHVAVTGDIVNVAAHDEFPAAAAWLRAMGPADWISFVPGNHDTYVRCDWEDGLGYLADYMTGDMRVKTTQTSTQIATPFPYVRLRRNVALIGLSTAVPQPLRRAAGLLGPTQIESLDMLLNDLRQRGYARVVMLHHPPLPGLAKPSKALIDAASLRDVLEQQGAELVLHGHNHEHMLNTVNSRFGPVNVLGVPSASVARATHHPAAAWNLYRIVRQSGRWTIAVTTRSFDPETRGIVTTAAFTLQM